RWLNRNKASALVATLGESYPALSSKPVSRDVMELVTQEISIFENSHLVILATVDDIIELFLNTALHGVVPRLHASVEPLDLGHHTVLVGVPSSRGCLHCLFDSTDQGTVNMISLVGPGQVVQASYGGCAGVFTPFPGHAAAR